MRILVTGATGFIGSAVVGRLHAEGHEVHAVARAADRAARRLQAARLVTIDIAAAGRPEDWVPHLAGIDAVVNCAGVFQDSLRDSTAGVHVQGAAALFAACEQAGVRRVIHVSALGVERAATEFSHSKLQGDETLRARNLDWVILRPSVVVGRAAYGGSAQLRALAALPILPLLPGTGLLQVVYLDDLTRTILFFLKPDAPARMVLDIVGPQRLSLSEIVAAYRAWLGFRPARTVALPPWLAGLMFRLGDAVSWLGWRPPMRTTAQREMSHGNTGDPGRWTHLTGIRPQQLADALRAESASVQEHWFAKLYFLKALGLVIFALFWIGTGLLSLGPGFTIGKGLLEEGGAAPWLASLGVIAGALADIAIGVGIAVRRTARRALYAALAISLLYLIVGTILVPRLWGDPLGPMLKIFPIMVLNLMLLAVLDDR